MKEITEAFVKEQIEELRKSTKKLNEVYHSDILNDNFISNIDCSMYTVAFNLLNTIREIHDDIDARVYNEFCSYMAGTTTYDTIEEFLHWLEEE